MNYTGGTDTVRVSGTAAVPSMGGMDAVSSMSANSNFTALGELIVPMTAGDHDSDADTPQTLIPTVSANGATVNSVETIRDDGHERQNCRGDAEEGQRTITRTCGSSPSTTKPLERAALEQEYYDAIWSRVLADATDSRTAQQRLRYLDTDSKWR